MNETSGTTVADAHGSNSATATNAAVNSGGVKGYCRYFDGSSDYINVGDKADLEASTFSLVAWLKRVSGTRELDGGIAKGLVFGDGSDVMYTLEQHSTSIYFIVSNTSNTNYATSQTLNNTDWNMAAGVFDGSKVKLSLNAGAFSETAFSGTLDTAKDYNDFVIGARDNGDYSFNGYYDIVSYWKTPLTITELEWMYNSGAGRDYADMTASAGHIYYYT